MEPLDREIAKALDERPLPKGPARILMVGSDHDSHEHLLPLLESRKHACTTVQRLGEARAAVSRHRWDVILVSPRLPDGSGLELLSTVQKTSPSTKVLLLATDPSAEIVTDAMRGGAIDLINAADAREDGESVLRRLDAAVLRSRIDQQREERLIRLKRICEELNLARREVTEQVDVLCNDLAIAYQDIGSQMNDVEMATEFRTLVKQELDVEDLLRTSLEYLLTKTGATNAAVFLADHDQNFGLGAYVNYDCPRDTVTVLLDRLCNAICPQMARESEIVAFDDAREFSDWIGVDPGILAESQILAWSCHHGEECLAVVILFRAKDEPFDEQLGSTIGVLRPIFAQQLANVITIHHRAAEPWPQASDDDPDLNDEYGFGFGGELAA